jgi:hypothetical protein
MQEYGKGEGRQNSSQRRVSFGFFDSGDRDSGAEKI